MENNNNKIITVSILLSAALAYVVVQVLMETFAAAYGPIARFYSMESVKHGLPMAVAAITFISLQFNKKVVIWADEVITEVKKVVWVSKKDVVAMTIVTCVMVGISCVILSVFDFTSRNLIKLILN